MGSDHKSAPGRGQWPCLCLARGDLAESAWCHPPFGCTQQCALPLLLWVGGGLGGVTAPSGRHGPIVVAGEDTPTRIGVREDEA
eukprot:CAMPEP_0174363274 /NCGR_PEP_ID=MMETSP0811_2-20130205/68168_1 /TAXON_ID=73025 ORGANISM="Eutreptiella gymnastica-like, Strain CCMP1594" /NCGR_SAMPLE_ID=MMETSP0811_2 /ASSEMBLY_ACC=CAM_ASM_000667 /LENGTH=83 /DNA_ID=CAMNT_0015501841 /DNA_START=613 /DNA_END=864 /DNA_ORIENTATION=+